MDHLRAILGWFKRQQFWVLSVLIALIAVGCWWSASGKLFALFNTNASTISAARLPLAPTVISIKR